jgi:hypothetical protein
LDPKDDTKISGGFTGGQASSITEEPVQSAPNIPSRPVTQMPQSSPMGGAMPASTVTSPTASTVTPTVPAGMSSADEPTVTPGIGLSQEEPVSTTSDIPMTTGETEETQAEPPAPIVEPTEKIMSDDTSDSGGGVSSL